MDVMRKHQIEATLAKENQQISSGQLKEDNPLDLSDNFRIFCEACRRGDLMVCQEMISTGVNINARDRFDYTPLILVGRSRVSSFLPFSILHNFIMLSTTHRGTLVAYNGNHYMTRLASAGTSKSYDYSSRMAHYASATPSKASDAFTTR